MTEFPSETGALFHSDSDVILCVCVVCVCVCVCVCGVCVCGCHRPCQHGAPRGEGEVPFQEHFFGFHDNVHVTVSVEL